MLSTNWGIASAGLVSSTSLGSGTGEPRPGGLPSIVPAYAARGAGVLSPQETMMNAITGRSSITSTLTGRGLPAFAGLEDLLFNLVSNLCHVDRMINAPRAYPHEGKGTGRTHG